VRTETFARNNPSGDRTLGLINKSKASQNRRLESMLCASRVRLELSGLCKKRLADSFNSHASQGCQITHLRNSHMRRVSSRLRIRQVTIGK